MLLMLHIFVAVAGLIFSTAMLLRPSKLKEIAAGILIFATLFTGTFLTIQAPSHLLQTCAVGLLYTLATVSATLTGRQKLALEKRTYQ